MNVQRMRRHFPADLSNHAGMLINSDFGFSKTGTLPLLNLGMEPELIVLEARIKRLEWRYRLTSVCLTVGMSSVLAAVLWP